jgi:hypothetical protein
VEPICLPEFELVIIPAGPREQLHFAYIPRTVGGPRGKEMDPSDVAPIQYHIAAGFDQLFQARRHAFPYIVQLFVRIEHHRNLESHHAPLDAGQAGAGKPGGMNLADAHLADHLRFVAEHAAREYDEFHLAARSFAPTLPHQLQGPVPR